MGFFQGFFCGKTAQKIRKKNPHPKSAQAITKSAKKSAPQNPRKKVRTAKSAHKNPHQKLSMTLVTRIAATSKLQIASDCNRNSKKSLRLRKHPLKPTLWTREPPALCGFYSVSEAPHGSGTPQNTLRLQGCDSESQRFFWPNAIFVIATLRFYCDFCRKSLRLRNCECQSLAICDCDCVGH